MRQRELGETEGVGWDSGSWVRQRELGGTGGVGRDRGRWEGRRGHQWSAVHMVASRLGCERAMVGTRYIRSPLTLTTWTGLENTTLTL